MADFEAWLPRDQLDVRTAQRADEHETFFEPRNAHSGAEAEEPCVTDDRARLLEDRATESPYPRLVAFKTAAGPSLSLTIVGDHGDLITNRDTEGVGSMRRTLRDSGGRVSSD